jgi:hypothetical protein
MDGIIVAFIIIIVFVGLILLQSQSYSSRKALSNIDLRSVRDAMMEKYGWTFERAEAAQTEYVRFLTLLQKKPDFMLVPWLDSHGRDDLDQFWHQHILDTAKYAADCQGLLGKMIHHNPHVVRGSVQEDESVTKTRRLYVRTFQTGAYGAAADPVDFSGCSACGTVTADSHSSHAGHGDGGSDGGHGHSCGGGHGCGHGCGGH